MAVLRAAAQRIDLRARQNAYVQLLGSLMPWFSVESSHRRSCCGLATTPSTSWAARPCSTRSVSLLIVVVWMMCLHIFKTHSLRFVGLGSEEYRRVWTATFAMFGGVAIVSTALRLEVARGYLAIAFPLGLIALTASRRLMRRYIAWQQRNGRFVHAIVLVGQLEAVREFAQSLCATQHMGTRWSRCVLQTVTLVTQLSYQGLARFRCIRGQPASQTRWLPPARIPLRCFRDSSRLTKFETSLGNWRSSMWTWLSRLGWWTSRVHD